MASINTNALLQANAKFEDEIEFAALGKKEEFQVEMMAVSFMIWSRKALHVIAFNDADKNAPSPQRALSPLSLEHEKPSQCTSSALLCA